MDIVVDGANVTQRSRAYPVLFEVFVVLARKMSHRARGSSSVLGRNLSNIEGEDMPFFIYVTRRCWSTTDHSWED